MIIQSGDSTSQELNTSNQLEYVVAILMCLTIKALRKPRAERLRGRPIASESVLNNDALALHAQSLIVPAELDTRTRLHANSPFPDIPQSHSDLLIWVGVMMNLPAAADAGQPPARDAVRLSRTCRRYPI